MVDRQIGNLLSHTDIERPLVAIILNCKGLAAPVGSAEGGGLKFDIDDPDHEKDGKNHQPIEFFFHGSKPCHSRKITKLKNVLDTNWFQATRENRVTGTGILVTCTLTPACCPVQF